MKNKQIIILGVFVDTVKWGLVVTTDEEALLCAITNSSSPHEDSFGSSSLRLIPTRFYVSTDSVPMVSVAGTPDGRIFLGGYDGSLYEMQYDGMSNLTTFSSSFSSKILSGGKRALERTIPSGLIPGSYNSEQPHRKCRKLNHTNKSTIFSTILPGFIQKLMSSGSGPIIDICVDSERKCLYTLTSKGILHCHNLSAQKTDMEVASSVDLLRLSKSYLNAVTRGQMYPPSSSIRFPGGGSAAAYGVGGMEGARSLLKASENESEQKKNSGYSTGGVLNPISLHIITKKESRNLTLLAITGAGVRLYLSNLGSFDMNAPGKHIYLCHVRAPPLIQDMLMQKDNGMYSRSNTGKILPGYNAVGGRRMPTPNAIASFYRNGTMMVALDGSQVLQSSRNNISSQSGALRSDNSSKPNIAGDLMLASTPDFAGRPSDLINQGYNAVYSQDPNTRNRSSRMIVAGGLSESLNIPFSSTGTSRSQLLPGGRIWEIASPSFKEYGYQNNEKQGSMLYEQLFWASTTPSDSELNIGLVPAIASSSSSSFTKKRKIGNTPHQSSTAIANTNAGIFASAIALIGYIINGKRGTDTDLSQNGLSKKWKMPNYSLAEVPLSVAYGTTTRNVKVRTNNPRGRIQNNGAKSGIPRWLLHPEICPLEELSTYHLSTSFDAPPYNILALNSGGLHFFQRQSVLDQLASCLHQGNPPTSATIRSFFETYGNKEGCTMALTLAVVKDNAGNKILSKRAIQAALEHANRPKLVLAFGSISDTDIGRPSQFNTALTANPSETNDKVLINGQQYEFKPSSLHNGHVLDRNPY